MSWSIGHDSKWNRDIGYGIPACCDHPECKTEINRGLSYVCCGEEPYGGDDGCGLYFCPEHVSPSGKCERCTEDKKPFEPSHDLHVWIKHKLTCPSWQKWRDENKAEVEKLKQAVQV